MRSLKNYSLREWMRIKPIDHFLIQICNDILQYGFRQIKTKRLNQFISDNKSLQNKDIGIIIAYESPHTISLLLKSAKLNLLKGNLIVVDNSRNKNSRLEIENICHKYDIPYFPLPPNPTKHSNRSHGMAMTWAYYNIVKELAPQSFTYLDHDLILMEKLELGRNLDDQPFFGAPKDGRWAWSLWAGYCSFLFSAVRELPLNFLNDFSKGLDTGGRNWPCLYEHFDRNRLRLAVRKRMEIMDGDIPQPVQIVDDAWIHIGGASYSGRFREKQEFFERLADAAESGVTLQSLLVRKPSETNDRASE